MRIANRTQELRLFQRMVSGEVSQRILLIEAPSGLGKTNLLLKFEHHCPSTVATAWVDLKAAQTGIAYLFSRIRKKLGAEKFPRFSAAVQQFLSGGVQVSDNVLSGQENQIQVVLNIEDENLRNFRLSGLQEAFFQDLSRMPQPVLLILDTFNAAPDTLASWIGGGFLAEVADTPNVFVVIAGQHTPQMSGEWMNCAHHCCLEKMTDREAWYKYAKDAGLPLNLDNIWPVVEIFEGQPAEIAKTLEALARKQQL
jgi:hypothetical protein